MKKYIMIARVILIALSIFSFSTLALALEDGISKTQGPIMRIDFNKNLMVVNEKTFIWNKATIFNDGKRSIIGKERFKPNSWVFIEGEKGDKYIVIKKVYLLPKYVDKTQRHLYPFMQ